MTKITSGMIQADLGLDFISAGTTTRGLDLSGAASKAPYQRFNLGQHVDDDSDAVEKNRKFFQQHFKLPDSPCWLHQIHADSVLEMPQNKIKVATADASFTVQKNIVLAIMTADCLPVVLASENGDWVSVVHCGWRSLAAGILSKTISTAPKSLTSKPKKIRAWFGPAIGPAVFEVGEEVKLAFEYLAKSANSKAAVDVCFIKTKNNKYLADLASLARLELSTLGLTWIRGEGYCTYSDAENFFSYRRDGATGRMATVAWIK